VPAPFTKEFSGGTGQVIHHKFVVVDFNGTNPVVFCGSSNLTSGGESANGDNLLAIYDREIATLYAIEGIRLADHYSFRDKLSTATDDKPMSLQGPNAPDLGPKWFADYYTSGTAKYRSRVALIQ
jgi:phosphatidylserine/phosphatidylglycerophosphate/cardiolipin synthase-like enzyme